MNVNIYLEENLYKRLSGYSKKTHLTRNMIIRRAIDEWLKNHEKKEWPEHFFDFEGDPNFPTEKELRKGLLAPPKDPLK